MSLAKASAVFAAPIPLRVILALTFAWAGLGKLVPTMPVLGEDAALLANMGVNLPATNQPGQQPTTQPHPETNPETNPEHGPEADPQSDIQPDQQPRDADNSGTTTTTQPEPAPEAQASTPPSTLNHTAQDFPEPVDVKRLHGLALLTYNAAHPSPIEDGSIPTPIWPKWAARDHWPVTLAWVAAITELVAAVLVLVGLLTRLSALSLAAIMLTAAWLTQLGPAIQSGDTHLGFLPNHDPWDIAAWMPLLWQLSLLAAALALTLAGPGTLSLDRAIGSKPIDEDDFEDDDDDDE